MYGGSKSVERHAIRVRNIVQQKSTNKSKIENKTKIKSFILLTEVSTSKISKTNCKLNYVFKWEISYVQFKFH